MLHHTHFDTKGGEPPFAASEKLLSKTSRADIRINGFLSACLLLEPGCLQAYKGFETPDFSHLFVAPRVHCGHSIKTIDVDQIVD